MKRVLLAASIAAYLLLAFYIGYALASKIIAPTEPPTMLLVGCGLVILFMVGRRRMK